MLIGTIHALRKLTLLTGLAGAAVSAVSAPVFIDSFDSSASPLWGNNTGGWSALAGVYDAASPSTFPNAHSSLPFVLQDFAVEFDVNNIQDGGIWLRSAAAATGIGRTGVLLVTGGRGRTGTGVYWHIVNAGSYGAILNEHSGLFVSGVSDAHFRVVVSGDDYSVFINGAQTAASTLSTSLFSSGQIALYDFSSLQSFDNVAVVPEPTNTALLACGLVGLALRRWHAHTASANQS